MKTYSNADLRGRRRDYLLRQVWCEVKAEGCWGMADHIHHRKRRSQGGTDSPANYTAVCVQCHDLIHRNPEWAYRNGWLVHSWETP